MTIIERLRKEGFDTVPGDFYRFIDLWHSWYKGKVKGFHRYRVYNGSNYRYCDRYSLGMAKQVCEDWANLLMNEKVHITLEGEAEQAFFDAVCKESHFETRCSEMQELKAALGTVAYIPKVTGVSVNEETGDVLGDAQGITIEYVYGQNIIPLSWENRDVKECAFASYKASAGAEFIYVQIHVLGEDGNYNIVNKLYDAKNNSLQELPLTSCHQLANVPEVIHTGSPKRQFVIDRMNLVNNSDPDSPMGLSVYANAIDQLKACDVAYDAYANEFVLGKKRIMVKPSALKDNNGNPMFDPDDVTFYWLPEDTADDSLIKEINMSLRSGEFNAGMQDMLNSLSAKCGLGENHYKFDGGSVKTATEVISANSTMFRTIKKHEIPLGDAITELARIILRMGNQYMGQSLNEDVEISIDFDDSIIEDKETDFKRDCIMLQQGIIQPYEFRMKWRNEDEQTAKAALSEVTVEQDDEE